MAEAQSHLTWILNLLKTTQIVDTCDTTEALKAVGQRIADDPLLNDSNRRTLRLLWKARFAELRQEDPPQEADTESIAVQSRLTWLLNLLTTSHVLAECDTLGALKQVGQRIANDPVLTDDNRNKIRLVYMARHKELST